MTPYIEWIWEFVTPGHRRKLGNPGGETISFGSSIGDLAAPTMPNARSSEAS